MAVFASFVVFLFVTLPASTVAYVVEESPQIAPSTTLVLQSLQVAMQVKVAPSAGTMEAPSDIANAKSVTGSRVIVFSRSGRMA